MKFKYIYLKNFRQFKGEKKILFSNDTDKNITIVSGGIASGKTTLLQSFLWCLYGKANFENDNLLNFRLMEEMKLGDRLEVFVEISLLSEETEYIIKRKRYFKKETNSINAEFSYLDIHYKQDDGQLCKIKSHKTESKINEILPEEISDYFFFDIEKIENISRKKNIKEAIKSLLGQTVLDNAIDHLGNKYKKRSVIGKLYRNLDLECRNDASNNNNTVDELIKKTQNKLEILLYLKYCQTLFDWLTENYDKKENQIREKLEESVNEIFMKFYHGARGVKINKEYYIEIFHDINGINYLESRALKTVENFLFFLGIVKLAKNKICNYKTKDCLSKKTGPLVIDSSFSHISDRSIEIISKLLPELAEQEIMFLNEFEFNSLKIMNKKIGKLYFIKKIDEIESFIEEA